jgi:FMN phosphatase YigB (HAD superfamily)
MILKTGNRGPQTPTRTPEMSAADRETRIGNSRLGVKALFFDVFGTLVDWRTGVAREAEAHLKPRGYSLDWLGFADAWRGEYQHAMEEVRSGRIQFSRLDVVHRRMLNRILPRFEISAASFGPAVAMLRVRRLSARVDAKSMRSSTGAAEHMPRRKCCPR